MQPCAPVRLLELNNYTQRSGREFAAALSTARSLASRPIKYMLIDPFDRSITEQQLRAEEVADFNTLGHWVNLHPPVSELQRVVQSPHVGSRAITEDKRTGAYTAVIGTGAVAAWCMRVFRFVCI